MTNTVHLERLDPQGERRGLTLPDNVSFLVAAGGFFSFNQSAIVFVNKMA